MITLEELISLPIDGPKRNLRVKLVEAYGTIGHYANKIGPVATCILGSAAMFYADYHGALDHFFGYGSAQHIDHPLIDASVLIGTASIVYAARCEEDAKRKKYGGIIASSGLVLAPSLETFFESQTQRGFFGLDPIWSHMLVTMGGTMVMLCLFRAFSYLPNGKKEALERYLEKAKIRAQRAREKSLAREERRNALYQHRQQEQEQLTTLRQAIQSDDSQHIDLAESKAPP